MGTQTKEGIPRPLCWQSRLLYKSLVINSGGGSAHMTAPGCHSKPSLNDSDHTPESKLHSFQLASNLLCRAGNILS